VDEHLKQRLVGAAVLVALAVIFLPSFFQRNERVDIDTRSHIPASPSIEPIVINKPIKPKGIVVPKASELFQPAPPQPSSDGVVVENVVKDIKSATLKDKESSLNTVAKTPKVDAKLNAKGVPLGWVLQVASFKSKDSAEKFAKTLSKGNDRAYFKSVKTDQGQFYRVYLGPLIDKNQAVARQKEINKTHKVKSQLLRFNPLSGN
jgi:DedD protein